MKTEDEQQRIHEASRKRVQIDRSVSVQKEKIRRIAESKA